MIPAFLVSSFAGAVCLFVLLFPSADVWCVLSGWGLLGEREREAPPSTWRSRGGEHDLITTTNSTVIPPYRLLFYFCL